MYLRSHERVKVMSVDTIENYSHRRLIRLEWVVTYAATNRWNRWTRTFTTTKTIESITKVSESMDDFSSHCVANDMVCHPPSMDFIGWGLSSTHTKRKEVLLTNRAPCLRESFACTLHPSSSMTSTLSSSTQLGFWCGHSSSWLPITSPIGLVPPPPCCGLCANLSRCSLVLGPPDPLGVSITTRGGSCPTSSIPDT